MFPFCTRTQCFPILCHLLSVFYLAAKMCSLHVKHAAEGVNGCSRVLSGNMCTLQCQDGFVPTVTEPLHCSRGVFLNAPKDIRCRRSGNTFEFCLGGP